MESGHYLSTALLNYIDSSDYCVACTALQNIIKLAGNFLHCTALQNIITLAGIFVRKSLKVNDCISIDQSDKRFVVYFTLLHHFFSFVNVFLSYIWLQTQYSNRKLEVQGGGGSDTFAYIWLSGFILRLTVKVILDKS